MSEAPSSPSAQPASQPTVLFFSRDIFFAPAVKSAALAAGCQFMIIGRIDGDVASEIAQTVRACVVDLTPLSLDQVSEWGQALAERFPNARRIAFGPHVQTEHFATAAAAGFHPVLAKGQVAAQLGRLLA